MVITLPRSIDTKFGQSIAYLLLRVLNPLHERIGDEPIEIDVSPCEFITPIIAAPLAALQYLFREPKWRVSVKCSDNAKFFSYGKAIQFPLGFIPEKIQINGYEEALAYYQNKTYIPIVNFPADMNMEASIIRDRVLQAVHDLLNRQLKLETNFLTAVLYLLDEMVNNVKDHARTERGFIFAQYYPEKRYLDVCIVDTGRGILRSFTEKEIPCADHSSAIQAAVSGVSTKGNDGRGFGIKTSIKMLVDGLGGNFFLMSGNAHILRTPGRTDINEAPRNVHWPGTLVALRIPFVTDSFEYQNYLE